MALATTGSNIGIGLPDLQDIKVKVSDNDTTSNFLSSKLTSSDASVSISISTPGGDEKIDLKVSGAGITSLNGLTGTTQTFATGVSGTSFNISSSGTVHTFNIPDFAGAGTRGFVPDPTSSSGLFLQDDGTWASAGGSDGNGIFDAANDGGTVPTTYNFTLTDTLDINSQLNFTASEVVFNDVGANMDFRVEGLTDPNMFFIDASNDKVGIGTNTPVTEFQLIGTQTIGDGTGLAKLVFNSVSDSEFNFQDAGANRFSIRNDAATAVYLNTQNSIPLRLGVSASTGESTTQRHFQIDSTGTTTISGGSDSKLNVLGTTTSLRTVPNANYIAFAAENDSNAAASTDESVSYDFNFGSFGVNNSGRILMGKEGDWIASSAKDSFMAFYTAENAVINERMRITSAGRVGILTTTPNEALEVAGKIRSNTAFNLNGTDGIGAIGGTTYTFGGGGSGDIASMTFRGGILTAVTTVP